MKKQLLLVIALLSATMSHIKAKTPSLIDAALYNKVKEVKLLLANGANVNAVDKNNNTAVSTASYYGHEQIVKLLLAHGANVNIANKYGLTALIAASDKGHEQIVKLLLAHGANVNALNQIRQNALMYAANGGHEQVVKTLVAHGAKMNPAFLNGIKNKPIYDFFIAHYMKEKGLTKADETAIEGPFIWGPFVMMQDKWSAKTGVNIYQAFRVENGKAVVYDYLTPLNNHQHQGQWQNQWNAPLNFSTQSLLSLVSGIKYTTGTIQESLWELKQRYLTFYSSVYTTKKKGHIYLQNFPQSTLPIIEYDSKQAINPTLKRNIVALHQQYFDEAVKVKPTQKFLEELKHDKYDKNGFINPLIAAIVNANIQVEQKTNITPPAFPVGSAQVIDKFLAPSENSFFLTIPVTLVTFKLKTFQPTKKLTLLTAKERKMMEYLTLVINNNTGLVASVNLSQNWNDISMSGGYGITKNNYFLLNSYPIKVVLFGNKQGNVAIQTLTTKFIFEPIPNTTLTEANWKKWNTAPPKKASVKKHVK